MNCTAMPELPCMISVHYATLNSRMWVAQATKTQPDSPNSDPNSLNTSSQLSFCLFCLEQTKEQNCQNVKWPQLSRKESLSRVRFRPKWNNQKGPLISDHLMQPSDSSTTTGSPRVRPGSGQWGELKHSSCSRLWSGSRHVQEHCFSLTPASISHLPDTPGCPLLLCLKATTASAVICSVTPCPGEGTASSDMPGARAPA